MNSEEQRRAIREARVRRQIEDAFADAPYPGDDRITYSPDAWECPEIIADFKGKHWKEVPLTTLRAHHVNLSLFSPEGIRHYLPAFLLAAFEDLDIQYFLLSSLKIHEPEEDKGLRELFTRSFGKLTGAQKDAVKAFLEFLRDEARDGLARQRAAVALARYWGI